MKINNKNFIIIVFSLVITLFFSFFVSAVEGGPSFQVTSFSCSPSEVVVNDAFSCTAQVQNVGYSSGSVGTATLYPDSNNWLEDSSYPQSSGTLVGAGQTTEITFSGLRATKSGNNGFARIMLDTVTDNYVSDNNIKVNAIDVVVTLSNSASSAAMGGSVTTTAEVSAGGNIDVSLTFTSSSGGCSIGSQTNPKTISGMSDGSKQSRTWTITQGTSGTCRYRVSAAATGTGGIASKIDTSSSSITCTDCPVTVDSPGGGSGGGGGGGSEAKIYSIGELSSYEIELAKTEKISFQISSKVHSLTLSSLTETEIRFFVDEQFFSLNIGKEIKVDVDGDNNADISVMLKSINTNKATIVLKKISGGVPGETTSKEEGESKGVTEKIAEKINEIVKSGTFIWAVVGVLIILAIVSLYYIIKLKRRKN